jgi:Fe-S-cluster containining protein
MRKDKQQPVFTCRQCGECCHGEKGILVTPEEAERLAAFLGLPPEELQRRYLINSPLGPQMATRNGACIFLENTRCQVHPVKPRICREWPFLPALLQHPDEFQAAKEACPGFAPDCRHENFVAMAPRNGKNGNGAPC